jgi:hypothetical protein
MSLPAVPNLGRTIRRYPLAAAQTYAEGGALILNAAGALEFAGADPATILGFAPHAAVLEHDPDPGFALVFVAKANSTYWLKGTRNPVDADVGDSFGILHDANGIAIVDADDAVSPRVQVETIDTIRNLWEVSVLPEVRQFETTINPLS